MLKVCADDLFVVCVVFNFFDHPFDFDQHSRSLINNYLAYVQVPTTLTMLVSSYHISMARKLSQYLHISLEALV